MSTELGPAPAGRHAEDGPAGTRSGVFALPARTSFRFALLIAAVAASSFIVYQLIFLATPRGPAMVSLMHRCEAPAGAARSKGLFAYASALHQARVCWLGAERTEAWWGLFGVGVLVAVAGAIFLAQPWWYRRRRHLSELTGDGAAELVSRLEGVRQRAGVGPVVWLLQPLNARLSAFAFGRPGRRFVAVSGGAAVAAVRKPAAFDAVILHELAHVKNRDIDQTYLALAIWRAFVVAALLPLAVLMVTWQLGPPQRYLWRVAVLALIVYLLRNSVLRSREFDADARARELDPETQLGTVLAGMPARTGRRTWHLGWTHPSGQDRAAALRDPAPLYRCGFWDGLAVGLVAAIGATAVQEIVTLMTATINFRFLVPAVIFGAFAGAALAVAMWRNQLLEAGTGLAKGWAAGLGLGLGLAVGPIIDVQAVNSGTAPDRLTPAAVGVLAVWVGLAVVVFTPFPVWLGHWADAWQQRPGMTAPRVPARGAMVVAAVAAWVVMAVGLYLLLLNVDWTLTGFDSGAASVWHQLPQSLRDMGFTIVTSGSGQLGGWTVCLVIVAIPLAAAVAHRRHRRPGEAHDGAVPRRRPVTTVLWCLAGCLAAVALTLAVSAVTHARIAGPVRWSPDFVVRLVYFDEQAIVVVAAVCALIAAVRARSARDVAICVIVGAAVAVAGVLALSNAGSIGRCFGSLSIQYSRPPTAGGCITSPSSLWLGQVVLGAALVSIIFVPAAQAAGIVAGRRIRHARLPAGAKALGWLTAGTAVIAAITGTALWGPVASAHGVEPAGSIGRDGWLRGDGYDIRLIPSWYALTQAGNPSRMIISYPFDGGAIDLLSLTAGNSAGITQYRNQLLRIGARPGLLDGAPGLRIAGSNLPGGVLEQWFIIRGPAVYLITLHEAPAWPDESPYLRHSLARMLATWHWTNFAKAGPAASPGLDPGRLTGTWTGSYTCGQGKTGLRLVIDAAPGGTLIARFDFYAIRGNPGVPSGSFMMAGTYSARGLELTPDYWIIQPPDYPMVGLHAGPPSKGDTILNGDVPNPGCTMFTVTRSGTAA